MRAVTILAAAAAMTVAMSTAAEARKRGLSLGSSKPSAPATRPAPPSAATGPAAPARSGAPMIFVAPRVGTPAAAPAGRAAAPVAAGLAAGAAVGAAAAAAPSGPPSIATLGPAQPRPVLAGCPAERVVGQGAGFCAIN